MTCPPINKLEQALVADSGGDILDHIKACPQCRGRAREIQDNIAFINDYSTIDSSQLADALDRGRATPQAALSISGYDVISEIHRGGQGIVYKAVHRDTKRLVALKTLIAAGIPTHKQQHRFEREIELVASLRDPNIVTLYDSGTTEDGRQYFAMEYIEGHSLRDHIYRDALSEDSTSVLLQLFLKIVSGVTHAHQRGIIHRDLKPSNIVIDLLGEPHVLDFGIAREIGPQSTHQAETVTGEFIGTFAYAAPEQVRGDPNCIDIRTDVYALGIILYELLTRRRPYPIAGSMSDVVKQITDTVPARPSLHNQHIGDEVDTIVMKALSKDPERRYQSAGALGDDIARHLAGEPIDAKSDSTWYVFRKAAHRYRAPLAVAVLFSVMVGVFAAVMAVQAQRLAQERDKLKLILSELQLVLSERQINHGRQAARAGNVSLAEELIWPEFLRAASKSNVSLSTGMQQDSLLWYAYWALWELYDHQPCLATLDGHAHRARDVAFSPDGRILASGGADGSIRIRDARTNKDLRLLLGHEDAIATIDFNRDGTLLASAGRDRTVRLWNASKGSIQQIFRGHQDHVDSVCFDPSGRLLASASYDGTIWIWNVATGSKSKLEPQQEHAGSVCISPDGRTLAAIYYDSLDAKIQPSSVCLWDMQTRLLLGKVGKSERRINTVSFSPNGRSLAWGGDGVRLELIDIQQCLSQPLDQCLSQPLETNSTRIASVCFSPDSTILAAANHDNAIEVFRINSGRHELITTLMGHTERVTDVAFNPDGQMLASASNDGSIKLWDFKPPRQMETPTGDDVHGVTVSPDGQTLISVGGKALSKTYRPIVWDIKTGTPQGSIGEHAALVSTVDYSPDGTKLVTASYDVTVKIWDVRTGHLLREIGEHPTQAATRKDQADLGRDSFVNHVCFSPDGRHVAAACDDSRVRVWDVESGNLLHELRRHTERIPEVAYSPDGRLLASSSNDKTVIIWEVASEQVRHLLSAHESPVRSVDFSPDGALLASGGDDSTVQLWDVVSGECVGTLEGHSYKVFKVRFIPTHGRLLASASSSGAIKLWDVEAQRELATLNGHSKMVLAMEFSPDGRTLISGSKDQTIHLWDLSYYDRHIAGNLEHRIQRFKNQTGESIDNRALQRWAAGVLAPYKDHPSQPIADGALLNNN